MSLMSLPRLASLAAAIVLPATLLHAAVPPPAEVPGQASLTGQLLIAAPTMGDPRFQHTVILMVRHDRNGALGIVINRPLGDRPLATILQALGETDTAVAGQVRIFAGGPVQPEIGFVVHSAEYQTADTLDIDGRVALTIAPEVLRDIGLDKGPRKSLAAFGYAGWAPAQLDNELAHGVWITMPEDPALVFDDDRAKLWDDLRARQKTGR